ncbi:MAG: hypothetical protein WBZ36_25240, partial [Candidatus Nitrosopolaris sp.]
NATEGFGIAGPLTGLVKKPTIRFLILAGLIGGGPTFIGTVVGTGKCTYSDSERDNNAIFWLSRDNW